MIGLQPELMPYDVLLTVARWAVGLICGTLLAGLWLIIAWPKSRRGAVFGPVLDFLRSLPVLGMIPFFQFQFGTDETGKLLLIAIVTSFPLWIAMYARLRDADVELSRLAASWSHTRRLSVRHYYVPLIFNGFATGVTVSIGIGWLVVVGAEMLGSQSDGPFAGGVGVKLFLAESASRRDLAFYYLMLFGALGLLSSKMWTLLLTHFVRPRLRISEF